MTPAEEITAQLLREETATRAYAIFIARGACIQALAPLAHHDRLGLLDLLRHDVEGNFRIANQSSERPR